MNTKVYVPVITAFDSEGRMQPFRIRWEDGEVYKIDRVLDVRPAPALKAGGQGIAINSNQRKTELSVF